MYRLPVLASTAGDDQVWSLTGNFQLASPVSRSTE